MTTLARQAMLVSADSVCRERCYRCGLVDAGGRVRLVVLDIVAFVWLCAGCADRQATDVAMEVSL